MLESILLVVILALVMEAIDSGLGMGYGTVLSPLLLAFGFSPLLVIPSVLLSQAIGGLSASILHHRYGNAEFSVKTTNVKKIAGKLKEHGFVGCVRNGFSRDAKIVLMITVLGVIATIIGALVAVNIPTWLLKGYIGVLVLVIGLLLVSKTTFRFSWGKIVGLGIVASFNKGISGGGFGPVTTGGQVVAGNEQKSSVGCTTLAEAPICIVGFLTYVFTRGLPGYELLFALCIGAFVGAVIGPSITKRMDSKKLKIVLGLLIILEGSWTLIKLFL